MKKFSLFLCALVIATFSGCDFISGLFGTDADEGRPSVPEPVSYIAVVPEKSDELVVNTVVPTNYAPKVVTAYTAAGNQIFTGTSLAMLLVDNRNIVQAPTAIGYSTTTFQPIAVLPALQLVRYWKRISDIKRYPGGTETSWTTTHTEGYSETESNSFTETVGASVTAGGGAGVVSVEATVSAEFSATQTFESTFETEQTVEHTVTIAPAVGFNVVYCTWQLFEEFRLVNATPNAEGVYEPYSDPSYVFSADTSLVVATKTIRNMTYKFAQ